MTDDYRELALQCATSDYLELLSRVEDLEAERNAYRDLLRAALEQLHTMTRQKQRLCARLRQLVAELRMHDRQRSAAA